MSVHSCCCIIFCIVWFEVGFQIELKFHFEIALERLEKEKMNFFPPFPLLACWPSPPARPASARACLSFLLCAGPLHFLPAVAQLGFSPTPHRNIPARRPT